MNPIEDSQRSIDAWNRHDAKALVGVYAEGGTYHNPRFDHPLKGQAIADFAKSVWTAYPDLRLEIISRGDTGGGLVATQWVLHGTHTGPHMSDACTISQRFFKNAETRRSQFLCRLMKSRRSCLTHDYLKTEGLLRKNPQSANCLPASQSAEA